MPICDTAPTPNECVECLVDEHCQVPTPACDSATRTCVECTTDEHCPGDNSTCNTDRQICECEPVAGGEVCGNDIDEDCDGVLDNGCECTDDADCPGPPNDGIVCDTDGSFTCGPGCRGVGEDAGCPGGQICTSQDASIGQCVPADGIVDGVFAEGGGCGCAIPGRSGSRTAALLVLLVAAIGALRRRRRPR
jgi:MYXO-CTERM domain-containing protein